jgi:hypothetical protein
VVIRVFDDAVPTSDIMRRGFYIGRRFKVDRSLNITKVLLAVGGIQILTTCFGLSSGHRQVTS